VSSDQRRHKRVRHAHLASLLARATHLFGVILSLGGIVKLGELVLLKNEDDGGDVIASLMDAQYSDFFLVAAGSVGFVLSVKKELLEIFVDGRRGFVRSKDTLKIN
jgi:hypothetical protein